MEKKVLLSLFQRFQNKIISLLRYDPLHRLLSSEGKKEIDLFTWDRVTENTLDVYREVV